MMCLASTDLVDAEVRVRGDDGAAGEVNALAGQVAAEAALLALEPLHKPPAGAASMLITCLTTHTTQKSSSSSTNTPPAQVSSTEASRPMTAQ